ncbi:MAG: hypothetical protein LBH60_00780 [Prevotellaceae bacterium]|jgi:hypothetical protein|nr:hypothetical protein [Prevotellaceae bacterium]
MKYYIIKKIKIAGLAIVLASMISTGIFMQSCSSEMDEYQNNSSDMIQLGSTVVKRSIVEASTYLELKDNRYVWTLQQKEALQIGLSLEEIDKIKSDLELANQQIALWEEQDVPFFLTDPETGFTHSFNTDINYNVESKIVRLKTGNEQDDMPGGSISTNSQNRGSSGCFAPYKAKNVSYNCTTKAALTPIYNVGISNFGNEKWGGGIGSIGTVSSFTLGLYASNTTVTVYFATSDSNGGLCRWNLTE